jgi:hypothetical protein
MNCFSTLAFKLLPGRLPAGTAKFEFQRAATMTRAVLATFAAKSFVLQPFYHKSAGTLRSAKNNPALGHSAALP